MLVLVFLNTPNSRHIHWDTSLDADTDKGMTIAQMETYVSLTGFPDALAKSFIASKVNGDEINRNLGEAPDIKPLRAQNGIMVCRGRFNDATAVNRCMTPIAVVDVLRIL